jgi:NTE family protein
MDYYSSLSYLPTIANYSNLRSLLSFYSSSLYGNKAMFLPRWRSDLISNNQGFSNPTKWTYLYDNSPLAKTLEKYIDYEKLTPTGERKANGHLIIAAVNVLIAEPLTFDSSIHKITFKHILAVSGYLFYFLPWTEIEKGIYCWGWGIVK